MRYSYITQKDALDRVIASIRTGVPIPRDDRTACADVLSSIRDWISAKERDGAAVGRKTARDLSAAMYQDMMRGR